MHLNPDCCRDVLLAIDAKPLGKSYSLITLKKYVPDYTDDELYYACLKLNEAGFIDLSTSGYIKHTMLPRISAIYELTFEGHEFLESIRRPSIWDRTKELASSLGTFSLSTLSSIATEIITGLIKSHL